MVGSSSLGPVIIRVVSASTAAHIPKQLHEVNRWCSAVVADCGSSVTVISVFIGKTAHCIVHFVFHINELIGGEPELFGVRSKHAFYRKPEFACTVKAIALGLLFAAVNLCNENDGKSFFAS